MSDGRAAMAASLSANGNNSTWIITDLLSFLSTLIYLIVVVPIQLVITFVATFVSTILQYLPLIIILLVAIFASGAWIKNQREITQSLEQWWRCELEPALFGPIPVLVDELADTYEEMICDYNAIAFSNRVLSKKTVTKILAECPSPTSYYHPIVGALKTVFKTIGAVGRWIIGFYKNKFPLWPTFSGISDVLEIIMRMANCLCEDLHPGFFYIGRIIANSHLYCAADSFVNAAVARVQYWITYAYNLITTMLKLIFDTLINNFSDFSDKFRTSMTEVSPVLNVSPERLAMTAMFVGKWLNDVIKSLICTIVTEIALHQSDNTLVNGTVPLPHTSIPPAGEATFLNETLYFQCMSLNTTYDFNIFGGVAHLAAAIPRAQFVIERIFPNGLFRIGFEFFTLAGPISDDGSQGFDINTPTPNDSTRFLMSVVTIDAVWDTIRRPLDTLRTTSLIEKWPNLPLYGQNSDQYDPPENSTQSCNPTLFAPVPQENLFCTECSFNRTEANVVTQIEILARQIDDVVAPLIEGRRLFTPLFVDIFGGLIRTVVAVVKFIADIYRHFFAGVDEFLIFLCRQNYFDAPFDELAGKPHELGGVFNGTVKFFIEIHPSLHVLPKFIILPAKFVTEGLRNIVRLIPQIINALKGIGGGATYGPRITEFYCLTGSPYCINVEEQFFKWLRVPRRLQVDIINIAKVLRAQTLGTVERTYDLATKSINITWTSVSGQTFEVPLDVTPPEFNAALAKSMKSAVAIKRSPSSPYIFSTQETVTMPVYDLGLDQLDRVHMEALFNEIANTYDPIVGGDVYYNTSTLLPYQLGWLECVRFFFSTRFINSFIDNPLDHITPEQFPDITCGIYYGGRFATELARTGAEFIISLVQTIVDAVNIGDPLLPAVVFRWLACTEPELCIPILPALSDTEDFVQCPCRFLGSEFLNTPCLCNITNSLGLTANELVRASLNLELTASQLIVCLIEFPTGVTSNTSSKACYTIVFDRVIDIFNKTYNATNDASNFGGGIGCLIGSLDPVPCGSAGGFHLRDYTGDMVAYAVEFVFSLFRGVLKIIESFFVFLRGQVIGATTTNPLTTFSFSGSLGILLDEIVTPAVGNPNITDSVGFVQSFGNALSCMFSDGTCDIASNSDSSACKGWFFVKVGNTIRDIYKCLRVIIVDGIGFWEDLFGGQTSNLGIRIKNIIVDGIWCLIETLITDLLDLIVTLVGTFLDLIFNTGTKITDFLHNVVEAISSVIDILSDLFFDIGQALDCSTCWSDCLFDTWDSFNVGDPPFTVCEGCWCTCQCQRPTLPDLPCRIDWDGDGDVEASETFDAVTPTANCTDLVAQEDLFQTRISCWTQCLAGFHLNPGGHYSMFGDNVLVPLDVCADCYCTCHVQAYPVYTDILLTVESTPCYRDWDKNGLIEDNEAYTPIGTIGNLTYDCTDTGLPLRKCAECWWLTLNASTPVNGNSSDATCLGGWCECRCQFPEFAYPLLAYDPIILTENASLLVSNGTFDQTAYLEAIDTIIQEHLDNGEYSYLVNKTSNCTRDWNNNGLIEINVGGVTMAESPWRATTSNNSHCPVIEESFDCALCWIDVLTALHPSALASTSDQDCFDGWCLCQCQAPPQLLFLNLPNTLHQNCTRDWNNDGLVGTYQDPDYLLEPFSPTTTSYTCGTNSYEACSTCWYNNLIDLPLDQTACDNAWCACQCQVTNLDIGIFATPFGIYSDFCKQDWDGDSTIEPNNGINPSETPTPCAKRSLGGYSTQEEWSTQRKRQHHYETLPIALQEYLAAALTSPTLTPLRGVSSPPVFDALLASQALVPDNNGIMDIMLSQRSPLPNGYTPSAALARAQDINMTLADFFNWTQIYKNLTNNSRSSNVCTDFMLEVYEKAQSLSPNSNSLQGLLTDYGYSDRALFVGCYSLLITPSLVNDNSNGMTESLKRSFSSTNVISSFQSLIKLPKYLLLDQKNLEKFVSSGANALQTFIQWKAGAGTIRVSPFILQQYLQSGSNSSLVRYNQTLLNNLVNGADTQLKRDTLARFSALMDRGPGFRMGKRSNEVLFEKRDVGSPSLAIHAQSFNDAFIMAATQRHPSMDLFVQQLSDYKRQYNLNVKAADQLGQVLNNMHESTVLDGLIQFTRGLRSNLDLLNPGPWIRTSIRAASTLGTATRNTKSKVLMIADSLNMQEPNASVVSSSAKFGAFGTRNPSFRVLAGETTSEKFNSLVSFYSLVWNDFKFKKIQLAKKNFATKVTSLKSQLEQSETIMRSVESYQYIHSQFPTYIPEIPPALTAWVSAMRVKQQVPLVLASNTTVGTFSRSFPNATVGALDWFNETECNVTRCFRCAVIKTVLVEIKEYFDFCVQRQEGNLSVIRHINITDPAVASSNTSVSDGFLFGLGKYINIVIAILFSSNMDPFTNTGEPLGLNFYITYMVPIPFYSTCDRDINTMCEFGYGFGTGLLVLVVLTLLGLGLWFVFPSTAGFLTTLISIVGYILFASSIIMAVSWGLNPLCLQTPGLSLISFVAPAQLPILPECAVRNIADTLFSVFQACYSFWAPLVDENDPFYQNAPRTSGGSVSMDNFTCPACPAPLPLIECPGFNSEWDEFIFGIHWISSWFHIPRAILPSLPNGLNITIERHQACFIWLLPSVFFWLGILAGIAILLPAIIAMFTILSAAYARVTNLNLFKRCC